MIKHENMFNDIRNQELQMKTTMIYYFKSLRLTKIKTKINVRGCVKKSYSLLVVKTSKITLSKKLTLFCKIEHILQPIKFTPTYILWNLLHLCSSRRNKNVPSSKGKDPETTECPSTGEWIHSGIFPQ